MEENKEPQPETQHGGVKTYAEDMAEAIGDNQTGAIKDIIHQEEEHQIEKNNLSPESRKNQFFMLSGLLLFLIAFGIITFFYFKNIEIKTLNVGVQAAPFIYTDKISSIDITELNKDKIIAAVSNAVDTTAVKLGGIEGIYLKEGEQIVGFKKFIELIKGNFVSGYLINGDSIVADNFLMGVAHEEVSSLVYPGSSINKNFFILLQVYSTTEVFDSLRAWENKMFADLRGLWNIELSSDTGYLLTKNFESGIVENKNARILYDQNNKIVLMYVFAYDNFVIIANAPEVVEEIMLRLSSSQIKK